MLHRYMLHRYTLHRYMLQYMTVGGVGPPLGRVSGHLGRVIISFVDLCQKRYLNFFEIF